MIKRIFKIADELLYPSRCAVCDDILPFASGREICDSCKVRLPYIEEPSCMKCGKEIESEDMEYCLDCARLKRSYIRGFPVFNYADPVQDAVLKIKYQGRVEYISFYAKQIVKKYGELFKALDISLIVAVPLHKNRMKKRGYNQAYLLAREIGYLLKIPCSGDILKRIRSTKPQKQLNNSEREKNINTAFGVNDSFTVDICGHKRKGTLKDETELIGNVLIVDDIYTTGATIEGCVLKLRAAGAKNIYYTSICIGAN